MYSVITAAAQPLVTNTFYGIFTHYTQNFHSASFHQLPGYDEPEKVHYDNGSGSGVSFGALVDFPLSTTFRLDIRGAYSNYGGTLSTDEPTTFINAGVPTAGVFTHRIGVSLSSIGIEPILSYNLSSHWRVHGGFRLATVVANAFAVETEITQPGPDVFIKGGRFFGRGIGNLPGASKTHATSLLGISYTIRATNELYFQPEIFYSIPLSPVTDAVDWKVSSLRAGIAMMLSPAVTIRTLIYDTITVRDTIERQIASNLPPSVVLAQKDLKNESVGDFRILHITEHYLHEVPRPAAKLSFTPFGVLPNRDEVPLDSLVLEEIINNRLTPLLNYVFFDQNSAVLPARYIRLSDTEREKFSVDNLHSAGTLDRYYHLLNIVGRRLTAKPEAKITITGCISGEPAEKENPLLAKSRAEIVYDYLLTTWKIKPERMKVTSRKLPSHPSNEQFPDGSEENRRVEITSTDMDILAPVFTSDTSLKSLYSSIILRPTVENRANVKEYSTQLAQNGSVLSEESSKNKLPKTIELKIEERKINRKEAQPLELNLHIENSNGETADAEQSVPVKVVSIAKSNSERRGTKIIDQYSLILFEFDNADILQENQKIINFIKQRLPANAKVSVTGTTDRMGDESHNQQLSERRAASAAKALILKNSTSKIQGAGEDTRTYTNDLPEGRFYSRTVNIMVERNE
jgi:outer membrane protein OmpA-like peptidoglycan-associated protein